MQFGGPPGTGAGGGGGGGGGARFHFIGPGAGGGFQLHGNPGDYAWGRGGLDAIITELLNHMDGAGPLPMARESIQQIPTVKISKEQMEKSQSCSVLFRFWPGLESANVASLNNNYAVSDQLILFNH